MLRKKIMNIIEEVSRTGGRQKRAFMLSLEHFYIF